MTQLMDPAGLKPINLCTAGISATDFNACLLEDPLYYTSSEQLRW